MNNENYLRKIWDDYKFGISLGSAGVAGVAMFIKVFSLISYCQNSSHSYDYCIHYEKPFEVGDILMFFIVSFIIAFILIYLFFIIKNFDKVKNQLKGISEENERRQKFEQKFQEKRQAQELEKRIEEEQEENNSNSAYDEWVKKVKKQEKEMKDKDYISITLNYYEYSMLYIWYEDKKYNLFLNSTDRKVYDKAIFKDKDIVLLQVDKLKIKEVQNYNSYEGNPKKSAAMKGAIIAGTAGAVIGANSTDKTKETVSYETNKSYYLECDTFKSEISKKDYNFLKDYINYNKE